MAISIRDNLSPATQESQVPMVRNDVGHPSFTVTIDKGDGSVPGPDTPECGC